MSSQQVVILEQDFDPTSLRPGRYTAHSAHPAYGTLYALASMPNSGVEALWMQYHEGGMKQIFVDVTGRLAMAAPGQRTVARNPEALAVPAGFEAGLQQWQVDKTRKLERPLSDYRDWRTAWWREIIQNATSPQTSGATAVDLYCYETAEGMVCGCRDNGKGMTEDILLNKLFAEAATGKSGMSGEPGGFGIAKEVLFWPWIRYVVQTRDLRVIGKGDMITKPETVPFRQGTTVEVLMPKDKCTTAAEGITVVGMSHLPHINFSMNDKRIHADFEPGEQIEGVIGADRAVLYWTPLRRAKKMPDGSTLQSDAALFVRDHGMYMFHERLDSDVRGLVIVELRMPSVQALQSSRDGFRDYRLRDAVNEFMRRLQKDRKTALRPTNVSRIFRTPLGKLSAYQEAQQAVAANIVADAGILESVSAPSASEKQYSIKGSRVVEIAKQFETVAQAIPLQPQQIVGLPSGELITEFLKGMTFRGQSHAEEALKRLTWPFDYTIISEHKSLVIERDGAPLAEYRKFYPDTMTPCVRRLVNAWAEACRYIMMLLGSGTPFGVGLVLSTDPDEGSYTTLGLHKFSEGEHWLLLNPWKDGKKDKGLLIPSQDYSYIYSVALHECTHLANDVSYHGDAFAYALTMNAGRAAVGFRKIKRIFSLIRLPETSTTETPSASPYPSDVYGRIKDMHIAAVAALEQLDAIGYPIPRDGARFALENLPQAWFPFTAADFERMPASWRWIPQEFVDNMRQYEGSLRSVDRTKFPSLLRWDGKKPTDALIFFAFCKSKWDGGPLRYIVTAEQTGRVSTFKWLRVEIYQGEQSLGGASDSTNSETWDDLVNRVVEVATDRLLAKAK